MPLAEPFGSVEPRFEKHWSMYNFFGFCLDCEHGQLQTGPVPLGGHREVHTIEKIVLRHTRPTDSRH